nr:glycosyltransferase [Phascolarctobacterium succinatutens]
MKILLFNLLPMIDAKGGAEKVFCNMANEMVERGHEVVGVCLENKEGKLFYPLDRKVKFINAGIAFKASLNVFEKLKTFFIIDKNKRGLYRERIYDFKKAKRIEKIIAEENPDVIISFNDTATRILENNLHTRIPVITMFHNSAELILKNASADTLKALAKSSTIQVLMPSFCKEVLKYVKNANVFYIPNVVPQYEAREFVGAKENVIINVARFDKVQKRQCLLVEAFSLIAAKYPDWNLELYGDTDCDANYFKDIKRLVFEKKLENRVLFKGRTINISQELFRAKIFAFPSAFEGFGLALTEAMSAGLPAVGYKNCPSVNELIKDGENGFLCEDGADAFAQALEKLISDEELRNKMGKAAKEDMKQYDSEKIWDMWEKLIKQVAQGNLLNH